MNRSVSEEPSDRLFIAFRLKKIELRYNPVYNLKIHKMQEHVSHVADGVDVIRDATVQLGKETDEIGGFIIYPITYDKPRRHSFPYS